MKFNVREIGLFLIVFIVFLGFLSFLAGLGTINIGNDVERIYLRYGVIFANEDNPKKEFNIILSPTMHINREIYKTLLFFKTPEEAEAVGFKQSENFARDYACVKAGKDFYECQR